MKCQECSSYINNLCGKAQEGLLSGMDVECLMRVSVGLLRDIWIGLQKLNANFDDGENWKQR